MRVGKEPVVAVSAAAYYDTMIPLLLLFAVDQGFHLSACLSFLCL